MTDEYINKKDVVNLGVMMQTHLWTREQTYNAIFCLPSADVAPVRHGRWKMYKTEVAGRGFFYCTKCRTDAYNATDYCPACGAKMDMEEANE